MVTRLKIFVQVMMIFMALDFSNASALCASDSSPVVKPGCCCVDMICQCHHDQIGSQSCAMRQAPEREKSIPAPVASAPSFRVDVLLYTTIPARAPEAVAQAARHRGEPNVSPPFHGSSPQAVLRLWLI